MEVLRNPEGYIERCDIRVYYANEKTMHEAIAALVGQRQQLMCCTRTEQPGETLGIRRLEHTMFEAAATSLALLRLRSQRFRWFAAQFLIVLTGVLVTRLVNRRLKLWSLHAQHRLIVRRLRLIPRRAALRRPIARHRHHQRAVVCVVPLLRLRAARAGRA